MLFRSTNNSGATRDFLAAKLLKMGFPVEPSAVFGSGISAREVILARGWRSVWVVGEPGLKESLGDLVTAGPADVVLVGIHRTFTYDVLKEAMRRIDAGAAFVATNRDATFPMEGGLFAPGAGTMVAAIATAVGREPDLVIGKPEPTLIEAAMRRLDRKSTRLNSSHSTLSRMPSSA